MPARILAVSYLPEHLGLRRVAMQRGDYEVVSAMNFMVANGLLQSQHFDCVVLCYAMPSRDRYLLAAEAEAHGVAVVSVQDAQVPVLSSRRLPGPADPCCIMDSVEGLLSELRSREAWVPPT